MFQASKGAEGELMRVLEYISTGIGAKVTNKYKYVAAPAVSGRVEDPLTLRGKRRANALHGIFLCSVVATVSVLYGASCNQMRPNRLK